MKVRFLFRAFFPFCIAFCIAHPLAGAPLDTSLCGPKSLQIVLKSRGILPTLEELCSLSRYSPKTGTTMLGLYEAAQAKKVSVAAVRMDIPGLCRNKESKIVFVDGNHFLVICGCDKDNVFIDDPFTGKYSQSKAVFQKRWNGETLLFGQTARVMLASRKPAPVFKVRGPRIQFDKTVRDFGAVDEESVLIHTFSFRNTGSDTLDVTVRSTCGCTVALLSGKRVPPGGMGKVRMEFKTQGRKGATSQSIHVRTNDPTNQMLTLSMTALVRGSVKVVPDRLWLDNVPAGVNVTREVLVADSGDGLLAIESVRVPRGITTKVLPPRKDKTGLRVIPIHLSIASDKVGMLEKAITIRTNDARKREITLPISGTVQARIKAFPPRLFFGEVKQDSVAQREVIISGTNGTTIDGVRVSSGSSLVSFDVVPMDNGAQYKVIATLIAPQSVIAVRDSVSIFLADSNDPAIDIPLYAKVVR